VGKTVSEKAHLDWIGGGAYPATTNMAGVQMAC
jgi:hypothetical protein